MGVALVGVQDFNIICVAFVRQILDHKSVQRRPKVIAIRI